MPRAEAWRWESLYRRTQGTPEERALLTDSPVPLSRNWIDRVNTEQTDAELATLRRSVVRGQPFGSEPWRAKVVRQMGLEHTIRARGRPERPQGSRCATTPG